MIESGGEHRSIMLARQADVVRSSWRRCQSEFNLDPTSVPIERVCDHEITERRSQLEELLKEASTIIHRARALARINDHVLLISCSNGIVLDCFADTPAAEELKLSGLDRGSVWNERIAGTNGIGTALSACQAITIQGRAHFAGRFQHLSCSAAPIFASDGTPIATVDMSTNASVAGLSETFACHLVDRIAAEISFSQFRIQHRNDCVLALSRGPQPEVLASRALLAVDETGAIQGATNEALSVLGASTIDAIKAKSIEEIWNVSVGDLRPLVGRSIGLTTAAPAKIFATTFSPWKSRFFRSKGATQSHGKGMPQSRDLDGIAGADPDMIRNIAVCRRTIDKELPLLILGETGVGKDTLARSIHAESKRALKPYIAINCAAVPETLLASELFGYEPGTFTDGDKNGRIGKIVAANGGTLLLDEIGDMPLELQAHFLRVLEDRTVIPLGSAREIPVNIKLICATHRNLPALVSAGQFRADLFYRIQGIQITLSPLRERRDFDQLVEQMSREEAGIELSDIMTRDVIDVLRRYSWPGNIRELRNVIRFLASIGSDFAGSVDSLPEPLRQFLGPGTAIQLRQMGQGLNAPLSGDAFLPQVVDLAERQRLIEALALAHWNVTAAARILGISRATLHRKILKFRIVSPNNNF